MFASKAMLHLQHVLHGTKEVLTDFAVTLAETSLAVASYARATILQQAHLCVVLVCVSLQSNPVAVASAAASDVMWGVKAPQ
jgi:hypothetical protein